MQLLLLNCLRSAERWITSRSVPPQGNSPLQCSIRETCSCMPVYIALPTARPGVPAFSHRRTID